MVPSNNKRKLQADHQNLKRDPVNGFDNLCKSSENINFGITAALFFVMNWANILLKMKGSPFPVLAVNFLCCKR